MPQPRVSISSSRRNHLASHPYPAPKPSKSRYVSAGSTVKQMEWIRTGGWCATHRGAKSIWSQKNVATIGRLVEAGRVGLAGLAAVEAA